MSVVWVVENLKRKTTVGSLSDVVTHISWRADLTTVDGNITHTGHRHGTVALSNPDESNFTDVFLFLDEDQSSNLSTFFAYGILEEDYNINLPNNLSNRYGNDNVKDYKAVKTTIVNKNIFCT